MNATESVGLLYIFQFAAMIGVRMVFSLDPLRLLKLL